MAKVAAADVVIIGGGIAGLWLLNRLRQSGLSSILFESGALGGGQTNKSQGIIHGGTKYALNGILTNDAQAIAAMPERWQQCFAGTGEIDLSEVNILSKQQYLWSPSKFTAKFTGFLASSLLQSKVVPLETALYPSIFQHPAFKGQVYSLDEMVIDVPSLIRELVKNNQDAIFKTEPIASDGFKFDQNGRLKSLTLYHAGKSIKVQGQQFIFTAGAGNEMITRYINHTQIKMQRRPLHMVLAKVPFQLPLYAHCLGMGNRPRITITSHYLQDGQLIWYLGGLLAEEGIHKDSQSQIGAALKELTALFPWLDFSKTDCSTLMVDRAEPLQKNNLKPESTYLQAINNMLIAWPTKLALAPKLCSDILAHLTALNVAPTYLDTRELRVWPMPPLATPIWEDNFCNNVESEQVS